jgi:hypothetical protein
MLNVTPSIPFYMSLPTGLPKLRKKGFYPFADGSRQRLRGAGGVRYDGARGKNGRSLMM